MPSKGVIHCALCVTAGQCAMQVILFTKSRDATALVFSVCSMVLSLVEILMSGPRVISVKHPIRRTEERHAMKWK